MIFFDQDNELHEVIISDHLQPSLCSISMITVSLMLNWVPEGLALSPKLVDSLDSNTKTVHLDRQSFY